MAKFDVEAAYAMFQFILRIAICLVWNGTTATTLTWPYPLACVLPCFIFHAIADMVEWILMHPYQISALLHYLDDFIMLVPQTYWNVHTTYVPPLQSANGLACLSTQGNVKALDSVNQVARLPAEKLLALQGLISSWPSLISVAIDVNWSPSMAIYIMLPKWSGLAEPSYVAWLTFCAASAKEIIWFASTASSTSTCFGGISSLPSGMVLASGPFQVCSPLPTWSSLHMQWDLWAMWSIFRGLLVHRVLGSFSAAASQ